jgi:hypothetical protein
MRLRAICVLASLAGWRVDAAELRGMVEKLDSSHARGWACQSDGSAATVGIYAGKRLLGIYPTRVLRGDVENHCDGMGSWGFDLTFGASTQSLMAGQARLAVYAEAPGLRRILLPALQGQTFNPLPLPTGMLHAVTPTGRIDGTVFDHDATPRGRLFAGGPPGEGTGGKGENAKPRNARRYRLDMPLPDAGAPAPGALLPIFGQVWDLLDAPVPLNHPIAVIPAANGRLPASGVDIPIDALVAQQGGFSAIRNTLFTTWMPSGTGFAGLSGTMSLAGTDAAFSEALVQLGTTGDNPADCAALNGTTPPTGPTMSRLWAGVVKNNEPEMVDTPVDLALPYAVPGAPAGTCLMTWISAGYAYLEQGVARYTTTRARFHVSAVPMQNGSPPVISFGLGGEFLFPGTTPAPQSVYVGIQADKPLVVDGIAGTASASPVLGAPPNSGWLPPPIGGWWVDTHFYYMPAQVCAAGNFNFGKSIGPFAFLRNGTPGTLTVPPGSLSVMDMPIDSADTHAIQQAGYTAFGQAPGGFTGAMAVGDCLVAYDTAATAKGGTPGVLDVENQSTVYLRQAP